MKRPPNSLDQWEPQPGSKAVIYCRVSSLKQVSEGTGLASQETRYREFAGHKKYEVVQVFHDEGVTGSLLDRPKIKELLAFLNQHKRKQQHVVIIDDISRLARDIETHIKLRSAIRNAGGKLESPSIEFGEDSDSRLVEHLLASVAAHQREKNTEQVTNRMRARMMNGYWVFQAPMGYRYEKKAGHGKILVRDEPLASIMAEAMEGYASGRFETKSEVKRFLESQPLYPKSRSGGVHFQPLADMFSRILYTGYIDRPDWGITLQPGKHEPLISYETFKALQNRLLGQAKAPARKDLNKDFPLRGFVTCGCCDKPLTACWATGRSGRYPYYHCQTKGCKDFGKSTRAEIMEAEFETLLQNLRPSPAVFAIAREMFQELWNDRQAGLKQDVQSLEAQCIRLDHQVQKYLERLVGTDNPTAVKHCESELTRLEEQIQNCGRPIKSFDDTYRTAMSFLANPCYLWSSDRLDDKIMVLRLAFSRKLPYDRNQGYRTAKSEELSLPFRLLENHKNKNSVMVRPVGIEPTTLSLEG
ncbi:MAG: recombinase family protein [Nitrospira sp.]|nr:recombinase family protein [Nitrospira sp.]